MPFVTRTIVDNRVKINHKIYELDESYLAYDGRWEGKRALFGIYSSTDSHVALHSLVDGTITHVHGTYVWDWWHLVDNTQR